MGFYTEKGLDKVLAGMPQVNPTLIMQDHWYWHRFLLQAKQGLLDSATEEVMSRSGCPAWLLIEVYEFNRVPTPGAAQDPDEWVALRKEAIGQGYKVEREGWKILTRLNDCATVREVAASLEAQDDLRFFWVDLHIGIRLSYGSETTGTWGASEIWQNALAPWTPWVE